VLIADHLYIALSPRLCLFLAGTEGLAPHGESCTTDFIVIPNSYREDDMIHADRFCGGALLPTTCKFPVIFTKYSENVCSYLLAGYVEYVLIHEACVRFQLNFKSAFNS
jgi:hypothetical protein